MDLFPKLHKTTIFLIPKAPDPVPKRGVIAQIYVWL